jgi:acetoin utilization deacetylase AcuC-like enzyme
LKTQQIALVTHPKSHLHMPPYSKPNLEAFEAPIRVQMAERFLDLDPNTRRHARLKAPNATQEDILRVHSSYVLDTVRLMSDFGGGYLGESAQASPDLYRSALVAAGGAILAAEHSIEKTGVHTFSLLRPPGHHATRSSPGGLCFFNNIAIAVMKARETHGIERTSIIDFDDHFGNGTAEIFYDDPSVQYISIHDFDFENYEMGHYKELGFGEAVGKNVNIPLLDGASDTVYKAAFERVVVPSLKSFRPQLIAVSAGFDSHYSDPVGNMNIDSSTYWEIGKIINQISGELEPQGVFSVLEGGYNPLAIGPSIAAYLIGLAGAGKPRYDDQIERECMESLDDANMQILDDIVAELGRFW